MVTYGFMQGKGQLRVLLEARSVEEVMKDQSFPDSLKVKLSYIKEIREFGFRQLGLKESNNYTTVYDQKGEVILWNLSACKPFRFEAKRWGFPLLGSFPYKGFFEKEKGLIEKVKLDSSGYDTRLRPVGGWSTLGWFSDPILSNMLRRSEGALAELILHELTHATLYVPDDIQFNENLATFIGEKGAVLYLQRKYGTGSRQLKEYVNSESDYLKFAQHINRGFEYLNEHYKSKDFQKKNSSIKTRIKSQAIQEIIENLDTISFRSNRYGKIFEKKIPNNAYFMSYRRYRGSLNQFELELQNKFEGDIKGYLKFLSEKYPSL